MTVSVSSCAADAWRPAPRRHEGNFYEDLTLGRRFSHPTPRTVGEAEAALYIALTGARQPLPSSRHLAAAMGLPDRPIDDILLFNLAFGKTVPDLSLNALANLGYADVRFRAPVYPGDTISARSEIIGRREVSNRKAGVVYVRTEAFNQSATCVLSFVRWVLVQKARPEQPDDVAHVPDLPPAVAGEQISVPATRGNPRALLEATQSRALWGDYAVGQRIDHPSGMTIDASDHTLATRLYQNPAKVHFDALAMRQTPGGERLVYGGHVISLCRALSYDGLENVLWVAAINGGTHVAPTHAGDTLYCATEVIDRFPIAASAGLGALRLRSWGLKNLPPRDVQFRTNGNESSSRHPAVVLELDYTVLVPVQLP